MLYHYISFMGEQFVGEMYMYVRIVQIGIEHIPL